MVMNIWVAMGFGTVFLTLFLGLVVFFIRYSKLDPRVDRRDEKFSEASVAARTGENYRGSHAADQAVSAYAQTAERGFSDESFQADSGADDLSPAEAFGAASHHFAHEAGLMAQRESGASSMESLPDVSLLIGEAAASAAGVAGQFQISEREGADVFAATDPIEAQLAMAQKYFDRGQFAAAQEILVDVQRGGDKVQVNRAKSLLMRLQTAYVESPAVSDVVEQVEDIESERAAS